MPDSTLTTVSALPAAAIASGAQLEPAASNATMDMTLNQDHAWPRAPKMEC